MLKPITKKIRAQSRRTQAAAYFGARLGYNRHAIKVRSLGQLAQEVDYLHHQRLERNTRDLFTYAGGERFDPFYCIRRSDHRTYQIEVYVTGRVICDELSLSDAILIFEDDAVDLFDFE